MNSEEQQVTQEQVTFQSLADFTRKYNVTFRPESNAITEEQLAILNTGIIQAKDMHDYRHIECLAFYYEKVNNDYTKAVEYFELARVNGSPYATHSLAFIYANKLKDYETSAKYYMEAISTGNNSTAIKSEYAFMRATYLNEAETGISTLLVFANDQLELPKYRLDASIYLFAIYYKLKDGKQAIKYGKMAADMGNIESMCLIYKLVNEYDPVIYDDDVFPNAVEESEKYITKALAMQSPTAFELYIRFKVDRANAWINRGKICVIPQDILESLVEYGRRNPDQITRLDTPATQQAWTYVATKLDIPCNTNVAVRINKLSKMAVCDICMSDCEKQCIPVNWCMHYACVDCYWQLADKPCPFCRCE